MNWTKQIPVVAGNWWLKFTFTEHKRDCQREIKIIVRLEWFNGSLVAGCFNGNHPPESLPESIFEDLNILKGSTMWGSQPIPEPQEV